MVSLHSIHYRY